MQENQNSLLMQTHRDFTSGNGANITFKSTTVLKTFTINTIKCDYVNYNTLQSNHVGEPTRNLLISNHLCKRENDTLKKVTQIKFGNKTITLTDEYLIESLKTTPKPSKLIKDQDLQLKQNKMKKSKNKIHKISKKQFFRKKIMRNNLQRISQKRDTKNIVKNFVKAFFRFCEEKEKLDYAMKIKDIMSKNNFNNSMVEKIIYNAQLVDLFQQFLRTQVQEWIQNSKVRDKDSHKEAIKIYLDFIKRVKQTTQPIIKKQTNDQADRVFQDKISQL